MKNNTGRKITRQEAELLLGRKFKGKYVQFSYPGYAPVFGRCDEIAIGTGIRDNGMVLIHIGAELYRCSPDSLKECLTLLKKQDGNTHTTERGE